MSIAYLQCDLRFNKYLLEKIAEKYVVEHTIGKIKKIGCKKIVAGIYDCEENTKLIDVLERQGVRVIKSNDNNVNTRFIDLVIEEKEDYVIRVGGDQVLIDIEKMQEIVTKMQQLHLEWFYDEFANCILPDIVTIECLKRYLGDIRTEKRYFDGLKRQRDIKKYSLPYPMLIAFNFRVNSFESMRICKNVIVNHLDIYELSAKLVQRLNSNNYLMQTGIWGSWLLADENQDFFYDENQEINPWWGRTIIDFLKPRLNKSLLVFEWGAGNSTLFWSQNVKAVVSIEYDREWYEKLIKEVPQNVKLRYEELDYNGNYCKAILDEGEKFDIILVDGRDRVRCAKNALERLKADGIIIWDDTARNYYNEGINFLKKNGFMCLQLESVGYKSVGAGHSTSIFYKENNICGI